jgi:phosphoglycerate dehydrogenase-like enzyme
LPAKEEKKRSGFVFKILLVDPMFEKLPPDWLGPGYEIVRPASFEAVDIARASAGVSGMLTAFRLVTAEMMDAAPDLKVVVRPGAGIDNIDVEAATGRGILVCNAEGVRGHALAEHAFFMMLYLGRHAWMKDDPVAWEATPGVQLEGKSLGIVGLGDIGRHLARIGNGFGLNLLVNTRTEDPSYVPGVPLEFVGIGELLSRADFLALAMPLVPETAGFIRRETIAQMKETAILVNLARGQAVVTADLLEAMEAGHLAGAGLDVTDPEPLADDHPLRAMPNVLITPHNGSRTPEAQAAAMKRAADNFKLALAGERPINLVNPEVLGAK